MTDQTLSHTARPKQERCDVAPSLETVRKHLRSGIQLLQCEQRDEGLGHLQRAASELEDLQRAAAAEVCW